MSSVPRPPAYVFFRDIETCPFAETCRYSKACVYRGQNHGHADRVRQVRIVAFTAVRGMLGALLFVTGAALSLTRFLMPFGLLLALVGIVLLSTSGKRADCAQVGEKLPARKPK